MQERSFLYELSAYLIYVKVGENVIFVVYQTLNLQMKFNYGVFFIYKCCLRNRNGEYLRAKNLLLIILKNTVQAHNLRSRVFSR